MQRRSIVGRISVVAIAVVAIAALAISVLERHEGPACPLVAVDDSRPRPQGDFLRFATHEPGTINPFTTADIVAEQFVLRYTHDPLMDREPATGELRPAIAESQEVRDEGRTLSFLLREGVRFSDGAPVTIDDVRFTLDVAQNAEVAPISDMTSVLRKIDSIDFPDEHTLQIRIATPGYRTAFRIATAFRIVQRRFFVDEIARLAGAAGVPTPTDPRSKEFADLLVRVRLPGPGTGPYRISVREDGTLDWEPDSHLNLVQNPLCWQREARPEHWNLAGMQLRFLVAQETQLGALYARELDWFVAADVDGLLQRQPDLRAEFDRYVYDSETLGPYYVLWNHDRGALGDARVRLALSMLFDRDRIVDELLDGSGHPTVSWFPPGSEHYPHDLEPLRFDVVEARRLLAEAGYGPDGGERLEIEILFNTGHGLSRRILEQARDPFRHAGIELRATPLTAAALVARQNGRDYDGIVSLIQFDDAMVDPFDVFHSDENLAGYENQEVDRILERARATLVEDERTTLYHRFNELFLEDQPVTVLAVQRIELLLHKRYQNVRIGRTGLAPESWWVEPEARVIPVAAARSAQ